MKRKTETDLNNNSCLSKSHMRRKHLKTRRKLYQQDLPNLRETVKQIVETKRKKIYLIIMKMKRILCVMCPQHSQIVINKLRKKWSIAAQKMKLKVIPMSKLKIFLRLRIFLNFKFNKVQTLKVLKSKIIKLQMPIMSN